MMCVEISIYLSIRILIYGEIPWNLWIFSRISEIQNHRQSSFLRIYSIRNRDSEMTEFQTILQVPIRHKWTWTDVYYHYIIFYIGIRSNKIDQMNTWLPFLRHTWQNSFELLQTNVWLSSLMLIIIIAEQISAMAQDILYAECKWWYIVEEKNMQTIKRNCHEDEWNTHDNGRNFFYSNRFAIHFMISSYWYIQSMYLWIEKKEEKSLFNKLFAISDAINLSSPFRTIFFYILVSIRFFSLSFIIFFSSKIIKTLNKEK